ncbi:hypothetical protein ACU4GD_39300 [Cupriavidus basilensis]
MRNQYVARKLNARGLATLLVDLIGPREPMRAEKRQDIAMLAGRLRTVMQAVPGYVRTRLRLPALPVGCFGTGTAAAAALKLAGDGGADLHTLVLAAGRVDLADADTLGKVAVPTLLVVGAGDPEGIRINDLAFASLALSAATAAGGGRGPRIRGARRDRGTGHAGRRLVLAIACRRADGRHVGVPAGCSQNADIRCAHREGIEARLALPRIFMYGVARWPRPGHIDLAQRPDR